MNIYQFKYEYIASVVQGWRETRWRAYGLSPETKREKVVITTALIENERVRVNHSLVGRLKATKKTSFC